MRERLVERLARNPFYVLGLATDCGRPDVEREGQKLLSMLALGLREVATYSTPLGVRPRTAELVRQAMAELREPRRRLVHELLAALPASSGAPSPGRAREPALRWEAAPLVTGCGPRRAS